MPLFDAYLFVDWSAANAPTRASPRKDALWLGELVRGARPTERYHRTRAACVGDVASRLHAFTARGLRVLVGFDFAYGYPRGLADALALPAGEAAWARTWAFLANAITDSAANASNRWQVASELNRALMPAASPVGPFWGCPAGAATSTLKPSKREGSLVFPFATRSGVLLDEWRHADRRARIANPSVQSAWKLFTSGSVGSQALLGIPHVARLRRDATLAPFSKVWPFEAGFDRAPSPAAGPFVLHAEVWPVLVRDEVEAQRAADPRLTILDQAQVRALCVWAERTDACCRSPFLVIPRSLHLG
jgi:hypothetical protein